MKPKLKLLLGAVALGCAAYVGARILNCYQNIKKEEDINKCFAAAQRECIEQFLAAPDDNARLDLLEKFTNLNNQLIAEYNLARESLENDSVYRTVERWENFSFDPNISRNPFANVFYNAQKFQRTPTTFKAMFPRTESISQDDLKFAKQYFGIR